MGTKNKTGLLSVNPSFNLLNNQNGILILDVLSSLEFDVGAQLSFTTDSSQHYSVINTDSGVSSVNVSAGSRSNTVTLTLSAPISLALTELLVSVALDSPNPTLPSEFNLIIPVASISLSGACAMEHNTLEF